MKLFAFLTSYVLETRCEFDWFGESHGLEIVMTLGQDNTFLYSVLMNRIQTRNINEFPFANIRIVIILRTCAEFNEMIIYHWDLGTNEDWLTIQ